MPLALIGAGQKVRIVNITGSDTVKKHLGSLGFIAGAIVTVVQVSNGSMILGLHDGRVAVNRDTVSRIVVEPIG